MKKNLYINVILMSLLSMLMVGCGEIEIFEDPNAKKQAVPYSKEELENGVYYVKKDTKFYEIHELEMSSSGIDVDLAKCAWILDDDAKIPDYYCNELIALASAKIEKEQMTLERFRDCGYSLGIYGAVYEDGYISFSTRESLVNDSSASNIENSRSSNILIESINGMPVTENMLNEAGIIVGLEANKDYELTFFAGTSYGKITVTADTHFLQSFEIYNVTDYEMTKNGYMAIRLPKDLECGYYKFGDEGFFRYYNFKRESQGTEVVDYNIPYYEDVEDQLAAFSQQFVFNLDYNTAEMSVKATFEPMSVTNSTGIVKMMLTSPDGKRMIVETDRMDGEILCDMNESMPGEWKVNISPQSMSISNVELVSNKEADEATKEVFDMPFAGDMTGVIFELRYKGEGVVTAQIIDEDNKSYDMVADEDIGRGPNSTHIMKYTFAYLPRGNYKVHVYHYPDTIIESVDYSLSEAVKDVEIIEIEE